MKLRKKTALIIVCISLALFAILYIVALIVIQNGFHEIEVNIAQKNVNRVITSIQEIPRNLVTKSSDWAKWDDLYHFLKVPYDDFIYSNLGDITITDLDLNYMLFVNNNDSIIYQRQYSENTGELSGIDVNIVSLFMNSYKLTQQASIDNITSGLIIHNETAIIIVARPILKSNGNGPSAGTLIFGKEISSRHIEHISANVNVAFEIVSLTSSNVSPEIKRALSNISFENPVHVESVDNKTMAGYGIMNDILNLPRLMIRISMKREIFHQANVTLNYLLFSLLLIVIMYSLLFNYIMGKVVIARTTMLNEDVTSVGLSHDRTYRVRSNGRDEIAMLAQSINTMLNIQEISDRQLRIYNTEMQSIMDTIQIGLFSIDDHFLIDPIHSRSSESILGVTPLVGKNIFDTLQINSPSKLHSEFIDFLSLLIIDSLPDEEMQGLNPCEELQIVVAGTPKWIHCEFHIMKHHESGGNHILVELKDITNEKMLMEEVCRSEEENVRLKIIAEDPDLFKEFLHESLQILEQTENDMVKLDTKSDKSIIHEIFRNIHLLKGTCDSFGLSKVATIAGKLEDQLGLLRNLDVITPEDINSTHQVLLKLSEALYTAVQNARTIFGEYLFDQSDIIVRIPIDTLKQEFDHLNEFVNNNCSAESIALLSPYIQRHHYNLRLEPVRKAFAKTFRAVPALIKRLEKNCLFKIDGDELPVDCMMARTLNPALLHTIRNALDHGMETPEFRLQSGKNETGIVLCKFSRSGTFLTIEIHDDGNGIDSDKVRMHALKYGLITEEYAATASEDELLNLLFKPGFTTAENISMVSGRGVGLDAVNNLIKNELGGSITLTTKRNYGTTFIFTIPERNFTSTTAQS